MPKLSRPHLHSSTDLITPYAATRAGFVQMALEKNRKATPLISEARTLQIRAGAAKIPAELLDVPEIQPAMLAAAGISDKAMTHLQREESLYRIRGNKGRN